ncbi:hypothetical protein F4801DRAFT_603185 [Xylaria longipes]|nr:hypothetical protein F4801DRAFT_603185 [Xylaria longipes]
MIPRAYRDPPPSYAEATGVVDLDNQANIRRHSTTNTSPTPVYGSSSSVAPHIFPPAFCLYCLSTRHYVIGQSQYLPLYAVSTHATLSSKPDLVIYNGASEDTPPLAFVDHEAFSRSAGITLPARQDSRFPASHELLESGSPFTRIMSFDIETAVSDGRREHFEWRHSSGVEKLVRVSPPPPPAPPSPPPAIAGVSKKKREKKNRSNSHGSDGKEVVAVWVATGMFMSRVLRFQFLGSGADGNLGER